MSTTLFSMEEDEMSAEQVQCRDSLKQGKRLLKDKNGAAAMVGSFSCAKLHTKQQQQKQQHRAAAAARSSTGCLLNSRWLLHHFDQILLPWHVGCLPDCWLWRAAALCQVSIVRK